MKKSSLLMLIAFLMAFHSHADDSDNDNASSGKEEILKSVDSNNDGMITNDELLEIEATFDFNSIKNKKENNKS